MSTRTGYTLLVCVVLVIFYTLFLFIPSGLIILFNQQLRHGVYALLMAGIFFILGRDVRPVRKAYQANMVAIITLLLYASMVIATSFLFGGGHNIMTPNISAVIVNLRIFAIPLLLGEYLRWRLIRTATDKTRPYVLIAFTFIFAIANMSGLRAVLSAESPDWISFFFESTLPAITISAVISYICIKSSLFSVLLTSFIFNLGGVFSPVLPTFDRIIWSLVLCAVVFVSVIIHHRLTDDKSAAQRKRIARAEKYASNNPVGQGFTIVTAVLMIAFFMQLFPIYPVVILTGSMTGYINRGSLVIMQRIPSDETLRHVRVGDVLHYHAGPIEFVHRVVGFDYHGEERVYITQGDANPFPDPLPLVQADVIGRPIFTIPLIGYPNIIFRAVTGGFF